ncbi:hypothetical protein D3C84_1099740 [compost metagenome]
MLIQHGAHLADRQILLAHHIGHDGRIQIAAARAHHQTFERGHPHARVNRLAAPYSGAGSAITNVTGNELQLLQRAS